MHAAFQKKVYAAKKITANNFLREAVESTNLGKEWLEVSPKKEAVAMHDGAESDQGGQRGRLVGTDEE